MKKVSILALALVSLSVCAFAGDGDLIVNGKIGIGTTSPSGPLHIYSSAPGALVNLRVQGTASDAVMALQASSNNATMQTILYGSGVTGTLAGTSTANLATFWTNAPGAMLFDSSAAAPMVFATNDVERMRITSTGNVGIGTASPDTLLSLSSAQPTLKFINRHCQLFTNTVLRWDHRRGRLPGDQFKFQ